MYMCRRGKKIFVMDFEEAELRNECASEGQKQVNWPSHPSTGNVTSRRDFLCFEEHVEVLEMPEIWSWVTASVV
jgi:hypothetical protein